MEELKNDFQGFYRIVIMDVNGFYMDFHGLSDDYITPGMVAEGPIHNGSQLYRI